MGKPVNGKNGLGVPQEGTYILIMTSAINSNKKTSKKKMFSKMLSPLCELYTLLEEVNFFSNV